MNKYGASANETVKVFPDIIGAKPVLGFPVEYMRYNLKTARVFPNIIGGKPPNAIAKAARFNPKAHYSHVKAPNAGVKLAIYETR